MYIIYFLTIVNLHLLQIYYRYVFSRINGIVIFLLFMFETTCYIIFITLIETLQVTKL